MQRKILLTVATVGIAAIAACSSDGTLSPNGADATTGTLVVKLTDDPFTFDSVARVDLYIARVDGRRAETPGDAMPELVNSTQDSR